MSAHPIATVRASSWAELLDCSLRWAYKNVDGLYLPATGAQALGTAIHAGTALWDRATMARERVEIGDAIEETTRALLHPSAPVGYSADDMTLTEALHLGRGLTVRYIHDIAPSAVYEAVEIKCDALDVDTESGTVRLTGTTDRIRRVGDARGIADLKSGRNAVSRAGRAAIKGHGFQLGIYQLMAEAASGEHMTLPAQIIGLHTRPNAMRVGVGEIANAKSALVGSPTVPGVIELAAKMLRTGIFPPNPSSTLCNPRYCPGYSRCPYHE